MKLALLCLGCALFAGSLSARLGVVETRDGHVYEGHIRFDSNQLVVVNAARELLAFVDLTNLAELNLEREVSDPKPEGEPPPNGSAGSWQNEDIGSVRLPGSASSASRVFHLTSSGTNIFGQSDSFHFVFRPVKGDSEMVARVVQVQYSAPWAKAGLMMRESLAADSRNVFLALTPVRVGVFQWRERPGETTSGEVDREMSVPRWIRLRREGNLFTASKSRNGRQWSLAGKVTIPMTDKVFVGMAVAGVKEAVTDRGPFSVNHSLIDSVREAPFLVNESFIPVVQLQSGSVAVGRILVADEWQIHFVGAPPAAPVPTLSVARILFRWLPFGLSAKINAGRPGLLLTSGDFIDGDFKGIDHGQVKISSVLLGWRSFDLNNDIIAVVLRRPSAVTQPFEVRTVDGSVWVGARLQIQKDYIVLQERSLGAWKIPVHELVALGDRR